MKLSLKQTALLQLVGLVAAGIGGAELVNFITTYFSRDTILAAISFAMIGGLLAMCYNLLLCRLEYQEKLKEITKKD